MRPRGSPQKTLLRKLAEIQARNPGYSLRAYAKRLGMSPATTSMVLKGTRRLSRKAALRVSRNLALDPQEASEFLAHFPDRRAATGDEEPLHSQLTTDQFRALSEWHYFAILSLIKTRGFRSDSRWIAGRLGIPAQQAADAIERMVRLGVLRISVDGRILRTRERLRSSDDVAEISLRKAHFESLRLAESALERLPLEERDFSSLTLALNPARLPEAKALIRRFQDEFDELMEGSEPQPREVYRLFMQLFPLSRRSE